MDLHLQEEYTLSLGVLLIGSGKYWILIVLFCRAILSTHLPIPQTNLENQIKLINQIFDQTTTILDPNRNLSHTLLYLVSAAISAPAILEFYR